MTTISPTATHTSLQRLIGLQTDGGSMSVVKATDIDATQAKRAAAFVAASSSSAVRNPMGVPMPRSPERAPTTAAEVPALLRGVQGVDMAECAADEVREMMGRTSRLVDGAFNAAANGGAEPAAVREQLSAFHADVTATPTAVHNMTPKLRVSNNAIAPGAISKAIARMMPTAFSAPTMASEINASKP